jgi:hypothetical protein
MLYLVPRFRSLCLLTGLIGGAFPPGYPSPSKRLINEPTLPAVDGDRACSLAVYPERLRLMLLSDDAARGVPI